MVPAAQLVRCPRLAAAADAVTATSEALAAPTPAAVPAAPVQDVSVSEERKPRSHTLLTVTISPRLCTAQYNKELAYFQKNTQVPGFRKGKKGAKVRSIYLMPLVPHSYL